MKRSRRLCMVGLAAAAAVAAAATGVLANEGASSHPHKVLLPMLGGDLFVWSPDSRQIAVPEPKAISLRGTDGRIQRRLRGPGIGYLGFPPCPECSLGWTDDGARIQFVSHENEIQADAVVGSIGVDGGDEQYRSLDVQVGEIAWAPAGWPLIYVPSSRIAGLEGKHVGPDPDLWRLDNLYGEPRKLIESRANEFDPLFSPDGTEIAFMRERKSSSSLWKVSAEGSNPQQLTGNLFGPSSAAWSPDGRWITFSTYDGEIRNVRPNAPDYRRSRDFPARRYKD